MQTTDRKYLSIFFIIRWSVYYPHLLGGENVRKYCYDGLTDHRMVPVSYTHLDVYKRQIIASTLARLVELL